MQKDSRSLGDCHPQLADALEQLEARLRGLGYFFVRTMTYRTPETQDHLYAKGRTQPGHVVTHARGGESPHNHCVGIVGRSLAADYLLYEHKQVVEYDSATHKLMWDTFGIHVRAVGLDWGGDFANLKDFCHVQLKNWRNYV
jgi:peptidoglycan LD-endopeptidase CwlK